MKQNLQLSLGFEVSVFIALYYLIFVGDCIVDVVVSQSLLTICVTCYTYGGKMSRIISQPLVNRFAESLTKGDVVELFRILEERYGTISKVCERVGIERRTFYHWREARQINVETKAKILQVALEEYPIDTLEFLARKSIWRTREALELLLELLRRLIVEEEDPEKVRMLIKKAEDIVKEFSTPVTEYLREEISAVMEASLSRGLKTELQPQRTEFSMNIDIKLSTSYISLFTATSISEKEIKSETMVIMDTATTTIKPRPQILQSSTESTQF